MRFFLLLLLIVSICCAYSKQFEDKVESELVELFPYSWDLRATYKAERLAGKSKKAAEEAAYRKKAEDDSYNARQQKELDKKYNTDPEFKKQYDKLFISRQEEMEKSTLPLAFGIVSVPYLIIIGLVFLVIVLTSFYKNIKFIFTGPKKKPEELEEVKEKRIQTLYYRRLQGK